MNENNSSKEMKPIQKLINTNGVTVKQLKELIKDAPEVDENGDDCTLWIETDNGLSSIVKEVWPLNLRKNSSDIIFEA